MEARMLQQYKQQAIDTMTQGELLITLYDELVKRLTRAELAMAKQEYQLMEESVDRSVAIINYLDDTLDRQYPISDNLTKLYEFFCYELGRVRIGRNMEVLKHVKTMVGELRESFKTAQQNNDSGK